MVPQPTIGKLWTKGGGRPIKAACGRTHTLLCFDDGKLLSCGAGDKGALGYGERKSDLKLIQPAPQRVNGGDVDARSSVIRKRDVKSSVVTKKEGKVGSDEVC